MDGVIDPVKHHVEGLNGVTFDNPLFFLITEVIHKKVKRLMMSCVVGKDLEKEVSRIPSVGKPPGKSYFWRVLWGHIFTFKICMTIDLAS